MADILQEKWMKGVAVTTTILAVMTAIAASRAGGCVATNQILTAKEGSQWAYFQSKSIKQNLREIEKDILEAQQPGAAANPEQKNLIEKKLSSAVSEISRYDKEKSDLKTQAEDVGKQNALVHRRGGQFSLSVVFFQIAIMLSSVSALVKRKEMWLAGLLFGIVACVYFANGFFLFF